MSHQYPPTESASPPRAPAGALPPDRPSAVAVPYGPAPYGPAPYASAASTRAAYARTVYGPAPYAMVPTGGRGSGGGSW